MYDNVLGILNNIMQIIFYYFPIQIVLLKKYIIKLKMSGNEKQPLLENEEISNQDSNIGII